ncbi:trypsin-like serine protease [Vibrio sp. AK197]
MRCCRFLILWLFSWSVSAVEVMPFIVNGSNANIANYPSFASLFYRTDAVYSPRSFCGATVINASYVLTAAHCLFDDKNVMLYTVIAPQLDDESDFLNSAQARAGEFYFRSDYSDEASKLWPNDIAIIKTATAMNIGSYYNVLNMTYNNSFPSGARFFAIGHGAIEGNAQGGTQLLEAELNLVPTSTCIAYFGNAITSKQLCFSGPVSGDYQNATCSGDSGGPVYWFDGVNYQQIGLTSFGTAVCGKKEATVTSVFTDIFDYQTWINRVITGQVSPDYYVTVQDGTRVLVDNTTQSEEVASRNSNSSGGGVLNWTQFVLFVWLLILRRRRIFH